MKVPRMSHAVHSKTCRPWETLLGVPETGQHVAELYTDRAFLVDTVCRYAGEGLRRGEAVLLVMTADHGAATMRRLGQEGFNLASLVRHGQLTALGAAETLSRLLENGMPDGRRFDAMIGGRVTAAEAAGYPTVRAFGEMVDLLRHTSMAACLRLEALWSELVAARGIALLCGYSLDVFDPEIYEGLVQQVAAAHSHLVPAPDYARLEYAVQHAYADVFGSETDWRFLRRAFLGHYTRPAAMPDAHAAILAAREFVPATTPALLERARHHYRVGPAAAA
jgi:hypothetical protein